MSTKKIVKKKKLKKEILKKLDKHEKELDEMITSGDSLFKALSDPIKRNIVETLLYSDEYVSDLIKLLKIGANNLSYRLKALKKAGLILSYREGRAKLYKINPKVKFGFKRRGVTMGGIRITFNN